MADKKYQLNALADFASWEQNFFDTSSISGVNKLCLTKQKKGRIMDWIDRGCLAIQVSSGQGNAELDNIIPWENRWVLSGRGFLAAATGNKDFANWTDQDVLNCVNYWYSIRQVKYITADTDEGPSGQATVIYINNPDKWAKFHNLMGDYATARGQIYFGQYSGSILTGSLTASQIRSIFQNNQTVLNYWKGAGSYLNAPYWQTEGYKHYGTILNAYDRGPINYCDRGVELVTQFKAARMAMDATGYNQPIGVYSEGVDNEINIGSGTVGHSGYYTRRMVNGKCIGVSWPGASLAFMRFKAFLTYAFGYYMFDFKPIALFGGDPIIIKPDSSTVPIFTYYPDGGSGNSNPPRAGTLHIVDDQSLPSAYPPHPLGFENASAAMDKVWEFAKAFVDNSYHYYPGVSVNGNATEPWGPSDVRIMADIKEKQLPVAVYGTDGVSKRWIYGMSHRTCTATFNMNGVTKTLNLFAGQDFFYTFD